MLSSPAVSQIVHPISVMALFWDSCKFAVFGIGSRSYDSSFNAATKDFSHQMHMLGALAILPLCQGIVVEGDLDEAFFGEKIFQRGKMGNFSLALEMSQKVSLSIWNILLENDLRGVLLKKDRKLGRVNLSQ